MLQRWKIYLPILTLGAALLGILAWTHRVSSVAPYRYPILAEEGLGETKLEFQLRRVSMLPHSALDHAELAAIYQGLGRERGDPRFFAKAEASARESLGLLPFSNAGATMVLAELAQAGHRFPEAIALSDSVLREHPNHEGALALRVESHLALGGLASAQYDADRLVQIAPSSGAFALRALVQEASARPEAALADFRRAYAAEDLGAISSAAWLRSVWARFHLRRGELRLARGLLREALRIRPDYPLALGLMGDLEFEQGHGCTAEFYFSEAYRVSGLPLYLAGQARASLALGKIAVAEELWDRAEAMLRESLSQGEFGHRRELASLLLERGRASDLSEALTLAHEELRLRRDFETLALQIRAYSPFLLAYLFQARVFGVAALASY